MNHNILKQSLFKRVMKIITLKDLGKDKNLKKEIKKAIEDGKIFIYPTDTIYGIGCNAQNEKAVKKIREIKKRDEKPFSVIAPSKKGIKENFIIDKKTEEDVKKYLQGPYTPLLKKKNPSFFQWISSNERIGIRIPKHDFTEIIKKNEIPFVITSVNLSGEPFAKSIKEVKKEILDKVEYIIEAGELNGSPSTLIIDGVEIKR